MNVQILKIDRRTGIIFNEQNNAVGYIGKFEPDHICWGDDDEILNARIYISMGGRIQTTSLKETTR